MGRWRIDGKQMDKFGYTWLDDGQASKMEMVVWKWLDGGKEMAKWW